MKRFGILFCFGLLSCEGGASKISNLEIVEESSSLGEYLQMESSTSLITVKRESPGGLVRVRTQDKSIEILDPDALQAKDIFFSQGRIAYRLGNAIRIWSEGKIAELPVVAAKLRGFQVSPAGLRLAWDNEDKSAHWMRLSLNLAPQTEGILPGSARATTLDGEAEVWAVQEPQALALYRWKQDTPERIAEIEKGLLGSYVTLHFFKGKLGLAYFDETEGSLKWAGSTDAGYRVERIDGEPSKTYRGMDISVFDDGDHPGFIYLDAWALKIRMARFTRGQWISEELDAKGALGFYSRILETTEKKLKIAFHSFRTDHADRHQSFEDLILADVVL